MTSLSLTSPLSLVYVIDLIFGEGKELPFLEDDEVPDPQVVWDRIEAARS